MRIGELSEKTGVSIATIRLYEREGLIAPATRTEGKFREFTSDQERRLDFIKRVRNLGFTLDDVKALLALPKANSAELIASLDCIRGRISSRKVDLDKLDKCMAKIIEDNDSLEELDEAFR